MPVVTTVTLGSLIEETLDSLYRGAERPAQVVMGSNALATTSDTTFTLSSGVLDVTTRVESPTGELMLVTAKSADATPVYTVARGYQNTTKGTAATGAVLLKDPAFSRGEVTRWIRRCISSLFNTELPHVEILELTRSASGQFIELPADTVRVLRVRRWSEVDERMVDVGSWSAEEVPSSIATSGRVIRTPRALEAGAELIVDVQTPYEWSGVGEEATVDLPFASTDIPVLWASAYAQARREVSRAELDKIEEWNQEQSMRAGVNLRLVREMWGEVYRRVDEAATTHLIPKARPYQRMR